MTRSRRRSLRWLPSRRRAVAGGALLGLALVLSTAGWAGQGSAATPPTPVQLKGEGTWGPYREVVPWQDDLYSSANPIDLAYTSTGSQLGRQDYVAGGLDYVISGRPFSDEELAKLKGGSGALIDVPIQVESLAFLLATPTPEGFESIELVCDPYDPDTPDPDACIKRSTYEGPIRVPNENLAAMAFRYGGGGQIPISSWNSADTLAAMGVANFSLPEQASPAPVLRSEPSATNYYLQEFARKAAPNVWAGLKALDDRVQWEPVSERLPRLAGASRQGVDQQSLQLGLAGADPASGGISGFTKGIVAPVPASAKQAVAEAFPNTKTTFIEMKNASGDWVSPTPESINKAVDAGGDDPLYALTNPAPGAYPLVWVNHLYAPAKGLTAAKTEALATTIRYLATDGQKAAAPVGEGRLSDALVKKALEGADELVTSNCVGSDRKIVKSTTPGMYAPDLPGIKAIGEMLHCEPVGAQPTTTSTTIANTIPPETTIPYDPGASFDPGVGDIPLDSGSGGDTGTTPVATTAAAATTTTTPVATTSTLPVVALPLAVPSGKPSGYDQLSALLMGGSLPLLFGPGIKKLFLVLLL